MLVVILLGIVGVVLIVAGIIVKYIYYGDDIAFVISVLCIVIGIIVLVLFATYGILSIATQATMNECYEAALQEKAALEYFIANADEDIFRNSDLLERINDFNKNVAQNKYRHNSLWVGWFYNSKIATIDYINLPTANKGGESK